MTASEKLKEIEKRRHQGLPRLPEEFDWMVERIERLTEASQDVLTQFKYHGTSLEKLRKALEGDE